MEEDTLLIIDEEGNEKEYTILFTFESDDTGRSYVLYYDASLDAPDVYSNIYDEEGNLYSIESPEEWDMIEEVFEAFMAEDEEEG